MEIESKAEISLSDMQREDYIAQIKSLSDTISQFKDLISYLKAAHESDAVEKSKLHALITSLTNEVCSLRKELAKQNDRNNRHNKHTFGKSSLKSTTQADNKPSREEEKQNYSAPDSLPQEAPASIDDSKVISEPLDSKRGPRGPYNPMDAAMVEVLECDMSLIPCGMKIFGTKFVDEYTRESFIQCTRFDRDAGWFVDQIGRLYAVEVENKIGNRLWDEIKERRNQTDVTETLNRLLSLANRMLKDKRIHFGEMMNSALSYMINGWTELLNYRHDGRYDIDNTEAERKIRPLTIGRKNTLFFGSEEGVEVATTYYTLIGTCKINGLAPLDYLTHVFRQLMTGNKNYESLLPGKFALQTT